MPAQTNQTQSIANCELYEFAHRVRLSETANIAVQWDFVNRCFGEPVWQLQCFHSQAPIHRGKYFPHYYRRDRAIARDASDFFCKLYLSKLLYQIISCPDRVQNVLILYIG